ncbi:unnamed protein product [Urochloa humidicola]
MVAKSSGVIGAAYDDALPGDGVEQRELFLAGEEDDAVAAVPDVPLPRLVQAREQEVAASDGRREVAVGADLRAGAAEKGYG